MGHFRLNPMDEGGANNSFNPNGIIKSLNGKLEAA